MHISIKQWVFFVKNFGTFCLKDSFWCSCLCSIILSTLMLCILDTAPYLNNGTLKIEWKKYYNFFFIVTGTAKRRLHKPVNGVYPTDIQDSAESAWTQWGREDVSIRFTQVWILQFLVQEVKVQFHLIRRKRLCQDQEWHVHLFIKLLLILTVFLICVFNEERFFL